MPRRKGANWRTALDQRPARRTVDRWHQRAKAAGVEPLTVEQMLEARNESIRARVETAEARGAYRYTEGVVRVEPAVWAVAEKRAAAKREAFEAMLMWLRQNPLKTQRLVPALCYIKTEEPHEVKNAAGEPERIEATVTWHLVTRVAS